MGKEKKQSNIRAVPCGMTEGGFPHAWVDDGGSEEKNRKPV